MKNPFNEIPSAPSSELREDIPRIHIEDESQQQEGESDALWLDFQSGADVEGIRSDGVETYVISPVTEQDLFSDKYLNCTGVIGIGRDRDSGREVAFISHQDPEYFIHKGTEYTEKFEDDLRKTLDELIARSEEGSIEVVVFGGSSDQSDGESKTSMDYVKSIEFLKVVVVSSTGKEPTVISGPTTKDSAVDVTVVTQSRKIVIGRW